MYGDIDTDTFLPYFDPILKFKQKNLLDVDRLLVVGVGGSRLDCNPPQPVPSPILGERRSENSSIHRGYPIICYVFKDENGK